MLKLTSALSIPFLSFFLLKAYCQIVDSLEPISSEAPESCATYYDQQFSTHNDSYIGTLRLPNLKWNSSIKLQIIKPRRNAGEVTNKVSLTPVHYPTLIRDLQDEKPTDFILKLPLKFVLFSVLVNDYEICAASFSFPVGINKYMITFLEYDFQHIHGTLPKSGSYINGAMDTPMLEKNLDSCGLPDMELFVIGNRKAIRGEHPWLTVIYKKSKFELSYLCVGSLVSSKFILSIAHCFEGRKATDILISLGRYNLSDFSENNFVQRGIDSLIIHPEYRLVTAFSDADLALLQMHDAVSFSSFIKPICLWNGPIDDDIIAGDHAIVVSWTDAGAELLNLLEVPTILQQYIASDDGCLRSHPAFKVITSNRTICAGNGTKLLAGSSGAGLIIYRNGQWRLRGVLSSALVNNGEPNSKYKVYTDTAKHLSWIESYIGETYQVQTLASSLESVCGEEDRKKQNKSPWLVAIYKMSNESIHFVCGGSLISSSTVLIAGHCLESEVLLSKVELKIYLGRYFLSNTAEDNVVARDVKTVLVHPKYKLGQTFSDFDIALLQMAAPVNFTEYIKPICLWAESDVESFIVGSTGTLTDWDDSDSESKLIEPKELEVKVVPSDQCQVQGKSSHSLCIERNGGLGPCINNQSNLGNILLFERYGRWTLRGFSSSENANDNTGELCKTQRVRKFCDVAKHLTWILKNMQF